MKSFDKLKAKLAELFQLDQADLDFGIYRIMNAKREEIIRFLEHDLLPQVREAFAQYKSGDKAEIQKKLEEAIQQAKALGADPETLPKVKELRARLEESVDITALEKKVYDHLYNFFSRYYDEGDFISLRRYKEGVYAIPYEGEEVKLYWANHDQYYIKTTEYFRDYAFRTADGQRVHFKIAEADTEKDNIKATNGKDRRFVYKGLTAEDTEELVFRFEYKPVENRARQAELNQKAVAQMFADLEALAKNAFSDSLRSSVLSAVKQLSAKAPTEKNPNRTVLEKHLSDYTKRNTFDYFIHKDLGKFLRRELDFYIKNEVMHLDDVEEESAARVEQYLSKIKVIRRIAHKIIDFLAQIENFQKKLWLKKKFVLETNYCLTLDRVPEELYPEIAANKAQREEWVRLFAIDELTAEEAEKRGGVRQNELFSVSSAPSVVRYSEPLTVEFLKANPYLVLDTRHFSEEFKLRLIAAIEDIDEQCDGVLVHSENFQVLNLMLERYQEQVKCVYIDPPYNTGDDGFPYKDNYQNSSWLAMMHNRMAPLSILLNDKAVVYISQDDNEASHLRLVFDEIFSRNNFLAQLVWKKKYTGGKHAKHFVDLHEYIFSFAKKASHVDEILMERPDEEKAKFQYEDKYLSERGRYYVRPLKSNLAARPTLVYPIEMPDGKKVTTQWIVSKQTYEQMLKEGRIEFRKKRDGSYQVYKKYYELDNEGMIKLPSIIDHTNNNEAKLELKHIFGVKEGRENVFYTVKPVALMTHIVRPICSGKDIVLDYFAGSGTTGHAVINLNREDNGKRKYILVEMGDYFDTVLMPRIKKVVYAKDWKNGKPVLRQGDRVTGRQGTIPISPSLQVSSSPYDGISHMFKYIRLESYEDALANIELKRTGPQQVLLDKSTSFRESYMLKYMLETEAKGSPSLLNIDCFDDPFNYKLLVGTGSVGETKAVAVDLVETFNWLLGLRVRHMDSIRPPAPQSKATRQAGGFRIVEGTSPKGEKVLIIWRKIRDLAETDPDKIRAQRQQANRDLEEFFRKQQYNTLDSEFDVIYVNGDNNLMNIPLTPQKDGLEPRYKVRLIEEEFKRLMFEVKDV